MGYLDPPEYETTCDVCWYEAGACVCPECPTCGEQGNPACEKEHGLDLSGVVRFMPAPEPEPDPSCFVDYEPGDVDVKRECPHGAMADHGCSACDVAADFAYDAAREDRHFGGGR